MYKPIGIVRSPFKQTKGTPVQPPAAEGIEGMIQIYPEFSEGLLDLMGFSHLILLYHFHLSKDCSLSVKPFLDDALHGVFATRVPSRPNSIGLSIVRLMDVVENEVYIKDVDIVDGTPLLDIKPYVPQFDLRDTSKIGWFQQNLPKLHVKKDDGRFTR